jgi:CTP synthase
VPASHVISARDVETIYDVPLHFSAEKLDDLICGHLHLQNGNFDISDWEEMVHKIKHPKHRVKIAICGKYVYLKDAYKSIIEAFVHSGQENDARVDLIWVSSEDIKKQGAEKFLNDIDGLLIPGGFGERGVEGKIEAIRYVREEGLPFLGICLGMQCAVIEYARNVCKLEEAHSYEFYADAELKHPVIHLMADQENVTNMGGTMRLGAYKCILDKNSKSYQAYGEENISERHRHRYEFNNAYREMFEDTDFNLVGLSPDERLVEIVEVGNHPWFVASQFHPELKSRPTRAHPLFRDFIAAAVKNRLKKNSQVDSETEIKREEVS